MNTPQFNIDVAQEFHRRMAAIINAVQAGICEAGVHDLLGYTTDYAYGQERGHQTLVLKTRNHSSYLRLSWNVILGDAPVDQQRVAEAIASAINELS